MNSEQVQAFLAVSDCLSFTEAAEMLFLSQPTISRHIRQLEGELGFQLFVRGNNYLELTPGGKVLADFFRETSEAFAAKLKLVSTMDTDCQRRLRIGHLDDTINNEYFFEKIDMFQALHPHCKIQYFHMEESSFVEALLKDEVDCVFVREYMLPSSKSLEAHKFRDVNMYLLYSKRHSLAEKQSLNIQDFSGEVLWTSSGANTQRRDKLVQAIQIFYGIQNWKTCPADSLEEILLNVRTGHGVFIADDNSPDHIPSDFCRIPLNTQISNIGIYIVKKKNTENILLSSLLKYLISERFLNNER